MSIPKVLHCCWFGDGPKSALIDRCARTWTQYFAGWDLVEWNETNTPIDNPFLKAAYERRLWAMVSDYVRLRVLEAHGGVYLDTDVEVVKGLDRFLVHDCFLGFQAQDERIDWVNNAVLGATAHHPFLSACMGYSGWYLDNLGRFPLSPVVTTQVLRYVGLREYGLQQIDGVTVYPTQYFYPYRWDSDFSEDCIAPETHCIHHWARSWNTPENSPEASPTLVVNV